MASEAPSLPSPIPTGKGLRSSAGPTFSEYINKSIQIPELTLPDHLLQQSSVPPPPNIDYGSVVARDGISVKRLLKSAAKFGVFMVSGHAILVEELRSILDLEETCCDCEGLVWRRSDQSIGLWAQQFLGPQNYPNFSQKMEKVASRLEAIAEEVVGVISENASLQNGKRNEGRESIVSLYRYSHHTLMDQNIVSLSTTEKVQESCEYALSLHLVIEQCEFGVQSECGNLSFKTSPDTIVVIVGKQLQDSSEGQFKSASKDVTLEPDLHKSHPFFSIELKFWPSKVNQGLGQMVKKISIADQIFIILVVVFLHRILMFIFS